jgi:hypothetical protein
MYQQIWIGSTDLGSMLRDIGGWWVGCSNERENIVAVQHAIDRGWLQKRVHYAPMFPDGSECWELTDVGLEYLGKIAGPQTMGGADKMRNWYRSYKKKWLRTHEQKTR